MTTHSFTGATASRFYSRWLAADPIRLTQAASLAGLSLGRDIFAKILQTETDAGMPLPRAMRRLRNLVVAGLIERDLDGRADMNEVVTAISDLAEFVLENHVTALTAEMIERHGTPVGAESGKRQDLIVLGMGKLGGRELNVSSDIDLIFVYPEDGDTQTDNPEQKSLSNHEFFTRLGKRLIKDIADITEDGFSFRVDMALRPNGASGPLVASFGMVEEYLVVQGREWERYAWVKARAITGQADDIVALEAIVKPFVYRRYLDFGAIEAMRGMHAQIRAEVVRQETRHPERSHNVKLGRGGIREIEFLSQVFQLIRGGRDTDLRDRSTRNTLRTLAAKQLLGTEEVDQLLEAYAFLRNLEHRLQYLDDAQTHTLPANETDRQTVANMMEFADTPALLAALEQRRSFVAARFDAIFADKSGQDGDGGETDSATAVAQDDDLDALQSSLAALGFTDAPGAAQRLWVTWQSPRLQSLPAASRNRVIALVNSALPLIAACGEAQNATLNRLLDFFEAIARRAAYLALLTEYPHALKRVVRMMQASNWAAQYMTRHPILLDELLDDRTLKAAPDWSAFSTELQRQMDAAAGDTERQLDTLREMHHAQLMRLLAQDLEGDLSVERLADHLSALADILVGATVQAVWQTIPKRHRDVPKFAVIAYGKLGGKELGYASDLDVIFLYDDDDQEAPAHYARLAQRFITWMTSHTAAGILFDVDIALRPDGASGLLVTSVASFEKYQAESAWLWEHQALTRARFCSGDAAIGARFEAIREAVLRKDRDEQVLKQEVRSMRQRMHDGHPNASGLFDLKHDDGGMIDIEFMVQYLILRHAAQHPELVADIGNIALLKLCGTLGLIDAPLAEQVANAYRTYRKLQHQIRLQGEDKARVEPERVEAEAAAVRQLWSGIFGQD
ncbi:bifunctional [glutamate--ammonia ligase]-adenylyl-L-tyrosine phosphorylase/[glutamate--ammonia-ligase] adenylyltransferase [Janthinobacterium sp. 17J80-10]|uniref:bifunctional [glutamate--ammonia ligase]-adenylyl-L-tyrosine phosphorylase/[glutamate--ammonia-ligase] adenylyltransferase n=1 Tax=Janthinobacterium sp. 17J80-10 TaxID=2497863 RepID=UPI00100564B2|nr:bifunctional [glutamate--ammonia ligase]-adenylyl-L-tyrosine phosphorylase/[glutamate--ammonia-ligase] adenylyltransferase [Janthinobacterium sp. 17J80-10]QAU35299.1 bifunctional [glutamate--ammonia ligase]-adenylyl-L-tyrosine phosphorylase/[glutamate--ammonia-ligase] adenylyltransferase [Janthinobacterium sp. 17J80-10]